MPPPTNNQVRVFVRTLDNGQKEARVWPPTLFASAGDQIEFINNTGDDIVLSFPDILQGVNQNKKQIPPGLANKHTPNIKNGAGAPAKGRQSYQIFCFETNSLAIGNSPPELIIE
jgi:hypothetical protein